MTTTPLAAPTDAPIAAYEPRIFDSVDLPADRNVLAGVAAGVEGVDLAAPPVVLPDFHHKTTMEMPSSIAVATSETIRPTLTSASVNCGMALLALDCELPTQSGIEEFYRRVRERYPYPPRRRRELSLEDVRRCAFDGGRFAADRFGVDAVDLLGVEENGTIDLDRYGGADRLRRELPSLTFRLARMRFGTVGPSNHFIELQQVEEILDPDAAALLGVTEGQLTLQYHAGGGVLTGEIGAIFGSRRHSGRALALAMAVQKPLFHLATARSRAQLRERYALYFRDGCPPLARDSDEGQRLMLANAAAMNYGFAFRLATYSSLRSIASDVFGAGSRLIVDSPHNSIYEEDVDGKSAVVHRHNSCRAFPAERMRHHPIFGRTGQPVLLPGTNRTSSYLCVAGSSAQSALYSACHGAGTIIDSFADRGISTSDPLGRSTLRFRYADAAPQVIRHLDDRGVDEALSILVRNGLVRPVARLRPRAVLN
jgi:tRNA-splicing ligase RtcB